MNRREELIKMAKCPCPNCIGEIEDELIDIVMNLELQTGKRVKITSGNRCEEYNQSIGGYIDSPHIPKPKGRALDMQIVGMSIIDLAHACEKAGFKRIGIYPNHVHGDIINPMPSKYWFVRKYNEAPIYSGSIKTMEEFLNKVKK